MIHEERPNGFNPRFEIVSCFVESPSGEILLLHRLNSTRHGNRWGVPAGRVEKKESLEDALLREVEEETGLSLGRNDIEFFRTVYVKHEKEDYNIIYHMYHTKVGSRFPVRLNPDEHKDFRWVTPKDALEMRLVEDLDSCIRLFYGV